MGYDPELKSFTLQRYIIESIILTIIYIFGAFAGIGSLLGLSKIYENKQLNIIHKIAFGSYIIILLAAIAIKITY